METHAFNLDTYEDEACPMPDGDFEFIQLYRNSVILVKVGVELPLEVRASLIECPHVNIDFFVITLHEMPELILVQRTTN